MNKQMEHFLGEAIKEVAFSRKPEHEWSASGLKSWIKNSILAYEKESGRTVLLRALELACASQEMYREKFILFLKSLEVEKPEEFIDELPELIASVGAIIGKAAKQYTADDIWGSFAARLKKQEEELSKKRN